MCLAVLSTYNGEVGRDPAILGQLLRVVCPSVLLVALVGDSHVLRDTYIEFARSGYRENLVDYPIFDLLLLRRCLQKCASVVIESLDTFSMTEFIIVRVKGAEHKDWMASRRDLRCAVVSWDLSMPSLVEVVGNIVGVWPPIVSFPKETGRKTDSDSLVLYYTSWVCFRI